MNRATARKILAMATLTAGVAVSIGAPPAEREIHGTIEGWCYPLGIDRMATYCTVAGDASGMLWCIFDCYGPFGRSELWIGEGAMETQLGTMTSKDVVTLHPTRSRSAMRWEGVHLLFDDGAFVGALQTDGTADPILGNVSLTYSGYTETKGGPQPELARRVVSAPQAVQPDTNGDGRVDVDDLIQVIVSWGTDGTTSGADVDGDGLVGAMDAIVVILAWDDGYGFGPEDIEAIVLSYHFGSDNGDCDGDGDTDVDDLIMVLLEWAPCDADDVDALLGVLLTFGTDGEATGTDHDGNGVVDGDDLISVLLGWEPCS